MSFETDFRSLVGKEPLPWQRALFDRFVSNTVPSACDLPTGLGKTMVIAIWLLALIANPKLPRRLVYVVNRRTVVDQSSAFAEELANALLRPEAGHLRLALAACLAVQPPNSESPLAVSTLRGAKADNADWRRDPSRPSVIVGTVDMIGSRLLFSGYGLGFKTKPLHAGFLGQDALLVHDEAHLEPAFQSLIDSIAAEQRKAGDPRPLKVLALSATGRTQADFQLTREDMTNEIVRRRLSAKKGIRVYSVADKKTLADQAAARALDLRGKVLVFLSRVEDVDRCARALRVAKKQVQVLTGTLRGFERDQLVKDDPLFGAFYSPHSLAGDVYLVATSAGEVGIDISADHLVSDMPAFDSLAQRLGRVNRYGDGDALVEILAEPLKERPAAKNQQSTEESESNDDEPKRSKDELEWARAATQALIGELPVRPDGRRDAAPQALRELSFEKRLAASSPTPEIYAVDEILFDRWSYTSLREGLPGRPPVEQWLHGAAEWEPPTTTVAWRNEVAWLEEAHLGDDSLSDFLADYPLRSRETLSARTDRVVRELEKIATQKPGLKVWHVKENEVKFYQLEDLLAEHDPKTNPLLNFATVILDPVGGGLKNGILDASVETEKRASTDGSEAPLDSDDGQLYDLGCREAGRHVIAFEHEVPPSRPEMRLVRAIRREQTDTKTGEMTEGWWALYAAPRLADDDGSQNSRRSQTLREHLSRTEAWAERLAKALKLPFDQQTALRLAGKWHDLGKGRRVWQRSIRNSIGSEALAKGTVSALVLGGYRHELGSLSDVVHQAEYKELTPDVLDLAMHVIAAHHGRARPHFPPRESFDPEKSEADVNSIVNEVPIRFERLQHKYGRWGLAWLESLLRAADALASDDDVVAP